jgi:hypothetical protein
MMDVVTLGDVNECDSVIVVAMDDKGRTWSTAEWEIAFPGQRASCAIAEAIAYFGSMELTVTVKFLRA